MLYRVCFYESITLTHLEFFSYCTETFTLRFSTDLVIKYTEYVETFLGLAEYVLINYDGADGQTF